jgi:glycosyltransferase involved in cell wall biosynthesis
MKPLASRQSVRKCHVAIFMTRGMSLAAWQEAGIFNREVALYERLQAAGVGVTFVTYGGAEDLRFAKRLAGMTICCNHLGLPPRLYERFLFLIHGAALRKATVFKTNQTDGADIALRAAVLLRRPIVARCGYMLSDFAGRQHGDGSPMHRWALKLEQKVFSRAERVVVTTESMAADIRQRLNIAADKLVVQPNYVDTAEFCPEPANREDGRLLFVGRLEAQKNLSSLLKALCGLPQHFKLTIIGEGSLRAALQNEFPQLQGRVEWLGKVAHTELPDFFRRSSLFVLPSFYEGHPKTLIEAMSCGCLVVAADAPGIREVIVHGQTGWLAAPNAADIGQAILDVSADRAQGDRLGRNARLFVQENYSLDRTVKREVDILAGVGVCRPGSAPKLGIPQ